MARTQTERKPSSKAIEMPVSPDTIERMYQTMCRIRRFEEYTMELFQSGLVKGTAHSYIGEEAIAAGACANLRPDDYIGSYHRGHGHCIAKGADVSKMMAELMGRETGYCGGLGGSMHIANMKLNILGANGIVGAAMPLGTGAALAVKLRGSDQVVISFFGDGAANQGIFHESINLASVWKLPIVYICENNQYALSTSYKDSTSVPNIADRAPAYGIPGQTIDGNDPVEVYRVVGEAVRRARAGEGPSLIEALTWRWGQHSMRANLRDPRTKDEMDFWIARDPIKLLEQRLQQDKTLPLSRMKAIQEGVHSELSQAVEFAKESAEPSVEAMRAAVYAPHAPHEEPKERGTREISFTEALCEAMRQEMERCSWCRCVGARKVLKQRTSHGRNAYGQPIGGRRYMSRHVPFDEVAQELIADPRTAAAYLEEAAQDPDGRVFLLALKDVIAVYGGVSALARKAGLNRPNLQNVLSGKRQPQFQTVARALHAAGFALSIKPRSRKSIDTLKARASSLKRSGPPRKLATS